MTLRPDLQVINSTMVASDGPKRVQDFPRGGGMDRKITTTLPVLLSGAQSTTAFLIHALLLRTRRSHSLGHRSGGMNQVRLLSLAHLESPEPSFQRHLHLRIDDIDIPSCT